MRYLCKITKTRAAAASSILSNPETLREAYEDSLYNSQGSAENELNAYLDSVEGKLQQFNNQAQELATSMFDSDMLKGFIDFGTSAVDVFTKLTDTFGGLQSVVGAVMGIFAQKSGWGLASYDKYTKSWTTLIDKIRGSRQSFKDMQAGISSWMKSAGV